jgi:hypothetical protein
MDPNNFLAQVIFIEGTSNDSIEDTIDKKI